MARSRSATIGLVAFALVVASDVAYLVAVLLLDLDPQSASILNIVFRTLTVWTPVLVFWVAVVVATSRRTPLLFAAIGVTAWAAGAAIYNVLKGDSGYVPSPAPSDIGYLAFYVFMVAAFVVLGARGTRRDMVPVALEATIAALGTTSVLLVLAQPVLEAVASQPLFSSRPLTLAYPLLDVALVAVTAGYASNPTLVATRRVWWLIAGIAAFVATDLIYAILAIAGTYRAGNITDMGWPLGLALMAWWALGFTTGPRTRVTRAGSMTALGLVAPVLSVVAAIGVLVYASQRAVNLPSVILATATVALTAIPVLTRQTLLSRLITGQERVLSELRELDVSKSEMMATLNHEMRTPLTSILGYLEVVRDGGGGEIPAPADEMLGAVEHSARRLHSIVDEMLILTRLDAHGLDVQMAPLDVGSVAQRVVDQLAPIAEGRQVALWLELDPRAPLVLGDDSRLGHALTTVAENAVKFTPNGGAVTISVTVRKHVRPVVIAVSDTGMGVPPDELPHLFERFFRGSNAHQSAVSGSGLGLAIARGIVELHGGRIRAESTLGEGTTILITLPAAD
jgi:signal transduction histidine kinase